MMREEGDQFSKRLEVLRRANSVPGVVSARRRDGTWRACASGERDVERALAVELDTPFEIGSLSKPLFACALLQMVREDRLDLDEPVDAYLAEPVLPEVPAARSITARHLLSHCSGLPNWRPDRWTANPGKLELSSAPGARWRYSGEGYQLLQSVIEAINGRSLESFMRERLFDPLGMSESSYTWLPAYEGRIARGYTTDGIAVPEFDPSAVTAMAAASLKSTVGDIATFIDVLLSPDSQERLGLPADPHSLFFESRVDVAPGVGWALGWGVELRNAGPVAWHWCNTRSSFWAFVALCDATGEAAIILTNAPGGSKVSEAIVRETIAGEHPAFEAPPLA